MLAEQFLQYHVSSLGFRERNVNSFYESSESSVVQILRPVCSSHNKDSFVLIRRYLSAERRLQNRIAPLNKQEVLQNLLTL